MSECVQNKFTRLPFSKQLNCVLILAAVFSLPQISAVADNLADSNSKVKVKPAIPLKVRAFTLQDVRLLDGLFKNAMELDKKYLLSLDVNRLLHDFRINAELFLVPGEKSGQGVTLEPFYKEYDSRYETYWDRFSPAEWQTKQDDYKKELARQKEMDSRTVDSVNAGEEQNERDHNMKGENNDTREFNDRKFRAANTNGWFAWELKVLPNQPQELSIAMTGGGRGGAAFDIFVDDTKLATERLSGFGRGQNGSGRGQAAPPKVYPLSADLLKGKEKITVKFQAPPDMRGGSVYSVRVLKPVLDK